MSTTPHEMSVDEMRTKFLEHVDAMIEYWSDDTRERGGGRQRLEGLAFSLLVALDGGAAALPRFVVIPCPHESDKMFHQSRGENWYPSAGRHRDASSDIAGSLHEHFHDVRRRR